MSMMIPRLPTPPGPCFPALFVFFYVCTPATGPLARPAAAAEAPHDGLAPLYARMAADIRAGRPVVATVHVALCDNKIIHCGTRVLGNGDAPGRNLYWGGAAGLRAYFDRARGWRRVLVDAGDGEHVLERAVYRRRVRRPRGALRRLGVKEPFDLYLVALGWRGASIDRATRAFVTQVATEASLIVKLPGEDGITLRAGGQGHIVGYAGHDHLMDLAAPYSFPEATRTSPVGFFALACHTAPYFGRGLHAPHARALLMTRCFMYPGAFTIAGLLDGIARGLDQRGVFRAGADQYARHQKRPERVIRRVFTHDGRPTYQARYWPKPPQTTP